MGRFLSEMRFQRVPAGALPIVTTGFTDCVGVLMAGLKEPVASIVARAHGIPFNTQSLAAFDSDNIAAPELALLYGTAAHALDYDDTGLSGHPSAVLVPAILAGARETGADGLAMTAAYVAGYEVWGELIRRDSDQHHSKGWHPTAVFGTVAAAAAICVLRKLDADLASDAVAIAASLAGGIAANFGTMTKPFHAGRAAQSGLIAARLAEAGMTASDDALEHKLGFLHAISPNGAVDTTSSAQLGTAWRILEIGVNVKLYPMCYGTHRALDALIALRQANGFTADDIEAVEVETGETQAAVLRNPRPQTALDAKFSMEFAMAAAAIVGRCTNAEVSAGFVLRDDVQRFFDKVHIRTIAGRSREEPLFAPFDRVRLSLRDGRNLVSDQVDHPRGHFKRPVDRDALWEKFSDCASLVLRPTQARHLFEALQGLPNLSSIRELAGADDRVAAHG
jgi:2-methylcitrate dehydratase PrpD